MMPCRQGAANRCTGGCCWQQQGPRRTYIVFTRATSHFERSLLKAIAEENVPCGMHARMHQAVHRCADHIRYRDAAQDANGVE